MTFTSRYLAEVAAIAAALDADSIERMASGLAAVREGAGGSSSSEPAGGRDTHPTL